MDIPHRPHRRALAAVPAGGGTAGASFAIATGGVALPAPERPATWPPPPAPAATATPSPARSRLRRLVRGRADDPRWVRPGLLGLLAATALLYLVGLGASGWANSFYAAAVQAGSSSWKAFFFGSFDSSSFITVDKPPAALWVMDLSARVFGVSSWSILVPEALAGVATVGLLYLTVRRWFSPAAALLAGAVMALTPVAVLIFRFNNPDALLVLLLTGGAYALVRAVEDGRTRWLVLAAALVGTGFLTKMLQAFLVVPAFALVYLIAAPGPVRRRLLQLLAAGAALVVASGWWVAIVQLVPAASRPYIGGSQDNSLLNLIFGYNGFGRITGDETGSVGGAAGTAGRWGATGLGRLFGSDMGGQVAWLLPAALVMLATGLWITRHSPRTDRTRAAFLLWGGWLLVTGAVLSFAGGIIHPYYTVALAPAIAALVAMGGVLLWRHRAHPAARAVLALTVAGTAVWAAVLLDRSPDWLPWLRGAIVAGGIAAAAALAILPQLPARLVAAAVTLALAASLAGPAAYAIDTAMTPHTGAIPSAGPAVLTAGPGGGGPVFAPPGGGATGARGFLGRGGPGLGGLPGGFAGGLPGGLPGGAGGVPGGLGGAAAGGLLDGSRPGAAITALLSGGAQGYTWVAATVGANSAAGYQLATGSPLMAIGGFNGTDPTPTLPQFQAYVRQHAVHYFIAGGRGGPGGFGATSSSSAISAWVAQTFRSTTVDGVTVYDLTAPPAGSTSPSA